MATKIVPTHSLETLDEANRKILKIVQRNNQSTHAAIGEAVGLSESAVRKRLAQMRQDGIIASDVSIVGYDDHYIQVIVTITLDEVNGEAHESFEALIQSTPEITEAFHVSGREDFVLIICCPSLSWYESWSMKHFVSNNAVGPFETRVVWSRKKYETAIPL